MLPRLQVWSDWICFDSSSTSFAVVLNIRARLVNTSVESIIFVHVGINQTGTHISSSYGANGVFVREFLNFPSQSIRIAGIDSYGINLRPSIISGYLTFRSHHNWWLLFFRAPLLHPLTKKTAPPETADKAEISSPASLSVVGVTRFQ